MDQEIWKDIAGFEGLYQVSSCGRVKNLKWGHEKIAKLSQHFKKREMLVGLTKKPDGVRVFMVHRLVATAFIPNPENKPEVNHKDFNRANNHVDNLEWVTRRENLDHFYRSEFFARGLKLNESAVLHIRTKEMTQREYGIHYGIARSTVHNIQVRKLWKHI